MNSPPTKKNTRSNSTGGGPPTLSDIKALLDSVEKRILDSMKKDNENINKSIQLLCSRLTQLETSYKELKFENDNLKQQIKELKSSSADNLTQIADELHLRSLRQCNIIIFGASEKKDGSLGARQEHDKSFCTELFSKIKVDASLDEEPFRLGRPRNDGHPRPVKIKCNSVQERNAILRASRELRDLPEYNGVFVHPDRTPIQQAAHKKLREELKIRRQNGEEVIIFRGKIVEKSETQNFAARF